MRTVFEIEAEMAKIKTAKRNAERKHKRCVARLEELKAALEEVENGKQN